MVTPSVKDNENMVFMIITQHNKCGNITNGFTQATVAKQLQHNNKVEEQ